MALPREDRGSAASRPTDAELAADAALGSTDALAAIYRRYARDLLAVAWRLLGSPSDAEDVVHDVFVGLPEALRRYEERGSLLAWLRTVTARVALMRLRARSAHPAVALDPRDLPRAMPSYPASIGIERALERLPPASRVVLVLREIEGFSHAEIAALLGISVGASEVRLHRAMKALRALLSGDETP